MLKSLSHFRHDDSFVIPLSCGGGPLSSGKPLPVDMSALEKLRFQISTNEIRVDGGSWKERVAEFSRFEGAKANAVVSEMGVSRAFHCHTYWVIND